MNTGEYRIISSDYLTSVHNVGDRKDFGVPEIAFAGRSNVGKSTLLNALCNRKVLAKTSKTPGRTGALNYFDIRLAAPESDKKQLFFVDLPGYGYARVSQADQKRWGRLIETYLASSTNLKSILLLIDSRRGVQEEELWFRQFEDRLALIVVLTKTDKISKTELAEAKRELGEQFALDAEQVCTTALVGKKKSGIPELLKTICRIML